MACTIASRINTQSLNTQQHKISDTFGALALMETSELRGSDIFALKTKLPGNMLGFNNKYDRTDDNKVAANAVFSSGNFNVEKLRGLVPDDSINQALPGRLTVDTPNIDVIINSAAKLFTDSNKILNAHARDRASQVILTQVDELASEVNELGVFYANTKDTSDYFETLKAAGVGQKDIYEGYKFIITSALARGFDVVVDAGINIDGINAAIDAYSTQFKPGKRAVLSSTFMATEKIQKIPSVDEHFDTINDLRKRDIPKVTVFDSSPVLNEFTSPRDRRVLNKRIAVSITHKTAVLRPLLDVFAKLMPNLNVVTLTTSEILNVYGPGFENSNGFQVNDKIVFNIDQFNSETVFHEFSHYFFRWLKHTDEGTYQIIMNAASKSTSYRDIQQRYLNNNIPYTDLDILEEVAVTDIGMNANKEFDKFLSLRGYETKNARDIDGLVDEFAVAFTDKLLGAVDGSRHIDLNSSVLDIFNFQTLHATTNTELLFDNIAEYESLRKFSMPYATTTEGFYGMVAKGMIRLVPIGKSGNNKVLLYDRNGTAVDVHGNPSSNNEVGTFFTEGVEHITSQQHKMNDNLIRGLEGYLNVNLELYDAKFQLASNATVQDKVNALIRMGKEVKLIEVPATATTDAYSYYEYKGVRLERSTQVIEKSFEEKASEDMYINKMVESSLRAYYSKLYIKDDFTADELNTARLRIATLIHDEFSATSKSVMYQKFHAEGSAVFALKTDEGTLIHATAELLVRSLNLISKAHYSKHYNDASYTQFSSELIRAIATGDKEYFNKFIFNATVSSGFPQAEVDALRANLDFVTSNLSGPGNITRTEAMLKEINTSLNNDIIGRLKGPLTFMPEIKVASTELGIAGTIDLLVFDGDGKGHIFDYKTKEKGKHKYWDYRSDTRMAGTMEAYSSNAKMKASIQTSLYRVILKEMGIDTDVAKVLYVEGKLVKNISAAQKDKTIGYFVESVHLEHLTDVTTEIQKHFIDTKGHKFNNTTMFGEGVIRDTIYDAAGMSEIDAINSRMSAAKKYYTAAVKKQTENITYNRNNANTFGLGRMKDEALIIILPGKVRHIIPNSVVGETDITRHIADLLGNDFSSTPQEAEFERIFYDGTTATETNSKDSKMYITLLKGADPSTHTLTKLSSNMTMGAEYTGVMLLTSRITGESRVVVLNPDGDSKLDFVKRDPTRDNVFGNFISTAQAKRMFPNVQHSGSKRNMRMIKVGLGLMAMKKANKDFKISYISTTVKETVNGVPLILDLDSILDQSKAMIKVMEDHNKTIHPDILALVKDDALTYSRNYIANPLNALAEFVGDITAPGPLHLEGKRLSKVKKGKALAKEVSLAVEEYMRDDTAIGMDRLLKSLMETQHTMARLYSSTEAKRDSVTWKLLDDSIMWLFNFNPNLVAANPNMVQRFITTASGSSNMIQATYNRVVESAVTNINSDYMSYRTEMDVIINDLLAEHNISTTNRVLSLSSKQIFANLFVDPKNENRETAYQLKLPSEVSSPAEKRALVFFKKVFDEHAAATMHGRVVPDRWMPLIGRSKLSTQSSTESPLKMAANLVGGVRDADMNDSSNLVESSFEMHFVVDNPFTQQVPTKGKLADKELQFSNGRRGKLGIDELGIEKAGARDLNRLEDNLENVLDAFVYSSLEAAHYAGISTFGRSVLLNLHRQEAERGQILTGVMDVMTVIQRKVINHETSEKAPAIFKHINNYTTFSLISGSVSQVLLEAFVNPHVTAKNYLADKVYNLMFSGRREYSAASYLEATRMVFANGRDADIIKKIDLKYGISSADGTHAKEILNKLESASLFQSSHLMAGNKMILDSWQRVTLAAFLIERKSLRAYNIDDVGNLVYDERKDGQYYDGNATALEQAEMAERLQKVKEALVNDRGALTGNYNDDISTRKLTRSLAPQERNRLKANIADIYATMDEASKSLATFYTGTNLFSKMKSWLSPKIPRYFKQPQSAEQNFSGAELVKVPDEGAQLGYRLEWRGVESEGIMYSVKALFSAIQTYKFEGLRTGYDLKPHQKKNLAGLITDAGMFLVMKGITSGLFKWLAEDDDDERKKLSPLAKLTLKRYSDSLNDLFLLSSLLNVVAGQGSMFVALSVVANTVSTGVSAMSSAVDAINGDDEAALDSARSALNTFLKSTAGVYKTGSLVGEQLEYLENE